MNLLEDLDECIEVWRVHENLGDMQGHWSSGNLMYSHLQNDMSQFPRAWYGNMLSLAVRFQFDWYINAKLASKFSLRGRPEVGIHVLIFALTFDEWQPGYRVPRPDCALIHKLLTLGADPNAPWGEFSVWQYVIHYLHVSKSDDLEHALAWLQLSELLLQNGADPHACCPEDFDSPRVICISRTVPASTYNPDCRSCAQQSSPERCYSVVTAIRGWYLSDLGDDEDRYKDNEASEIEWNWLLTPTEEDLHSKEDVTELERRKKDLLNLLDKKRGTVSRARKRRKRTKSRHTQRAAGQVSK